VSDGVLLLPELLDVKEGSGFVELTLMINPKLPCFAGHFDGFPLVPGVVQVGWAVALAVRFLSSDSQVKSIEKLKFTHPIQPGQQIHLLIKRVNNGQSIDFSYKNKDQACAQGRVVLIDEQ
jgi:3-hydroxyacyl-[acyl-carrier-protein] dehydratase